MTPDYSSTRLQTRAWRPLMSVSILLLASVLLPGPGCQPGC